MRLGGLKKMCLCYWTIVLLLRWLEKNVSGYQTVLGAEFTPVPLLNGNNGPQLNVTDLH